MWLATSFALAGEPVMFDAFDESNLLEPVLPATPPSISDPALEARLFGYEQPTARSTSSTEVPWWTLGVGFVVITGMFLARGRLLEAATLGRNAQAQSLEIVSRAGLGGSTSVVLVDVAIADGSRTRLLLGTGGDGPSVLANLGTCRPFQQELEQELEQPHAPTRDARESTRALMDEVLATRNGSFRGTA